MLYARVSTKKQADAGNLDRQMERLRQYARENGFTIRAEFMDVASGLNQKRRGLLNVIKLAERGEFKNSSNTPTGWPGLAMHTSSGT